MNGTSFLTLALGLVFDRLIGDPPWLWVRLPHPVVIFGRVIDFFDRHWNAAGGTPRAAARTKGAIAVALLLMLAASAGLLLRLLLVRLGVLGLAAEAVLVGVLLAQKSLASHVLAVADGLRNDGQTGGRRAVAMIVGRDPETLDESGVIRAAIESLAENAADGVIAPVLWYIVLGLPGIFALKALNTADSMIGHKTPRHLHFGWAAARLDDLANWPAARLSVLIIAAGAFLAAGSSTARRSVCTALRDARLHRSPNSGWPEAAMAGALDLRLAGPRVYAGETVHEPMLNASGQKTAKISDIVRGVSIFYRGCDVMLAAAVLGFLLSFA